MIKPLITIKNLTIQYIQKNIKKACLDVNLLIFPGDRLGIIGESGCGKTTLLRSINRLLPENALITSGEIHFNEEDLFKMGSTRLKYLRKSDITMVFQDAMNSLNPSKTIGNQMMELIHHVQRNSKEEAKKIMIDSLNDVGLSHVEMILRKYPFELSGGMLQRISLAMSFLSTPKVILADEPTSLLDVVSSHHVLALLNQYVRKNLITLIIATHQISVIKATSDQVIVMYFGSIVEIGKTKDVLSSPLHPYTKKLLCSMIYLDESTCCQSHHARDVDKLNVNIGGCSFYSECNQRQPKCLSVRPELTQINQRKVACLYVT